MKKSTTTTNDVEMIRMAILGYQIKLQELADALVGLTHAPVAKKKTMPRKNRLGPQALARIAEAQKKRWAEFHRKKRAAKQSKRAA